MVLDLTHCSDQAFWQALDHYGGPVLASHNNCRALVPHQRQFTDDQIRAMIERDGVIGAALDAWMLKPAWVIGPRHDRQQPDRHAQRCRRSYRPYLPAGRQQPPCGDRHRPGRRLRARAVAGRPRHDRRSAEAARRCWPRAATRPMTSPRSCTATGCGCCVEYGEN